MIECLGRGAHGSAYHCKQKPTALNPNEDVVVKTVFIRDHSDADVAKAMMEVSILGSLSHPNIVQYYEYFIDPEGLLCMAMEYASGGDLGQLVKDERYRNGSIPDDVIFDSGRQLLNALAYLRTRRVMHRDVKPDNILVAGDGLLRLSDFGVSRLLDIDQGANTFTGTPFYISPELCLGEPYSFGADMWSLGVTLYEMATLEHPFKGTNLLAIVNAITDGIYKPVLGRSGHCVQLIAAMLTPDPTERLSAAELLGEYFPAEAGVAASDSEPDLHSYQPASFTTFGENEMDRTEEDLESLSEASPPALKWLDRRRGDGWSEADSELEQKIRAKAEALQRKRLLLFNKNKTNKTVKQLSEAALSAEAELSISPQFISPPGRIKARFLTSVCARKAKENNVQFNDEVLLDNIVSDDEHEASPMLDDATHMFQGTASKACIRSIQKVMEETVKRRRELGIVSDSESSSDEEEEEAEEDEEEEEETHAECTTAMEAVPFVDPDLLQVKLLFDAQTVAVYNIAEGAEFQQVRSAADALVTGKEGNEGEGSSPFAMRWVDSDGDKVSILTEADMVHATEAFWAGEETFLAIHLARKN